jgi:hypothetical protein
MVTVAECELPEERDSAVCLHTHLPSKGQRIKIIK